MRIGIDASPLAIPFFCGTRTYAENLIISLAKIDKVNKYVVFSPKTIKLPSYPNFKYVKTIGVPPNNKRHLFLNHYVQLEKLDVLHILNPYGDIFLRHKNIITTVHDVNLNETYPYLSRYFVKRLVCDVTRAAVFSKTKIFITPTKVISQELRRHVGKTRSIEIFTIPDGVDERFRKLNITRSYKSNYLLTMSDYSERKNLKRILLAYSNLPDSMRKSFGLTIVLSTKKGIAKLENEFSNLGIETTTRVLVSVATDKLIKLYNGAYCFIYPSLYEGFGLPILEAMACGCPVITSNFGAMKEVSGNAALLINPHSVQQLRTSLKKVIMNRKFSNNLSKKGLERVKNFNWENVAKKTLDLYSYRKGLKKHIDKRTNGRSSREGY